jgi:hypothetical protein
LVAFFLAETGWIIEVLRTIHEIEEHNMSSIGTIVYEEESSLLIGQRLCLT